MIPTPYFCYHAPSYYLPPAYFMTTILVCLVLLGFLSILVEDLIHIDKAKTTLFFGSLVWILYFIIHPATDADQLNHRFNENLLDVALLWLFLFSSMTFVVYLSDKGVIQTAVLHWLPEHIGERRLLFIMAAFAFILSSFVDNITTTLVCITILSGLNLSPRVLMRFLVLLVFAVNSGGVSLITGDVTTFMIFLAGKVSIPDLLKLILPAFIAVMLLATLLSWPLKGDVVIPRRTTSVSRGDVAIAGLFLATIVGTIAGNLLYGIPPVLTFLAGLATMFLVVQFKNRDEPVLDYVRRIEFETLLFFLGVLLLVGMLKELSVLEVFPVLYTQLPPVAASFLMGICSSVVDNVPLTAALLDSGLEMDRAGWLSLTYAVGVGGSLLVIGSAAGVVAMGKVPSLTFGSYLRYFPLILAAYVIGYAGVQIAAQ